MLATDTNIPHPTPCSHHQQAFASRLGLLDHFPTCVHHQSRLGQLLAPVVKALDLVAEKSGPPGGTLTLVTKAWPSST